MKVTAVTPVAAASDPQHPDHDRWVKDTTFKFEVEHAHRVGKTLRDAETENAYWLQRAESRARMPAPPPTPAKPPRKSRSDRFVDRGVTVTAPTTITNLKPSPCGRCGTCRNCMRERRVLLIMQKRKEGPLLAALADKLVRASLRIGKFARLRKGDYERAVAATCEEVCNSSVALLGKWHK